MSSQPRLTPDRAVLIGAVLAALAYIQDIRYDFILDDVPLILMNETIASWRNWKTAFTTHIFEVQHSTRAEDAAIHYRPIYKLWQMLNDQLFGAVIPWWHITSLLLHIAAILLIYRLGVRLLRERWTAALGAVLFAFHPIHAESVAYITASTDLLVTVFSLLALLGYLRFREEGASRVCYFASVPAAALAMFSKENAIIFPWLLVAYEALREDLPWMKRDWKRFVWTLPFFAIVGAYLTVRTFLFGLNAGPGPGGNRLAALFDIPLVFVVYLRKLFWPVRLSFFYPGEWSSQWTLWRAVAVALVMALGAYLWTRYRDRSGVRLQILWALILFVPAVLGVYTFVHDDWVHDRHMYFVSVPICLAAAAILTDRAWPQKVSIAASSAILALLLVGLALSVPRFTDNTSIYASAVKVAPRSLLVHGFYAEALWNYGRRDEGLREYEITTELAPNSARAHANYGFAFAQLGRDDEAAAQFQRALQCSPPSPSTRALLLSELGQIELRRSDFSSAAAHLRDAVQLDPEMLNYHALLAQALRHQGADEEAREQMRLETGIRLRVVQEQRASRE